MLLGNNYEKYLLTNLDLASVKYIQKYGKHKKYAKL